MRARLSMFLCASGLMCLLGACGASTSEDLDGVGGGSMVDPSVSAGSGGTTLTGAGNGDTAGGQGGTSTSGGAGSGTGGAPMGVVGAPVLTPGVWKDITPPGVPVGAQYAGGQGFALDPTNPSTLYACFDTAATGLGGIFKTTDAGSTWARIGASSLDFPMHPRVDPKNPQHLYVGTGVRSKAMGFWVSHDGGNNWVLPPGFQTWAGASGSYDTYDIAVDPTDFKHVLVSFHSPWRCCGTDSGVAESKDGGDTWVGHIIKGSGAGNSATFLFDTALGIGNSSTWLVGTQGSGFWRTTDAGTTWTRVTTNVMTHGGNQIYYTKTGVLFSGGAPKMMRSMDNGLTWTTIGPDGNYTSVFGDGSRLYSARYYGPAPFLSSDESDGLTWTPYEGGAQKFVMGPFEQAFDRANGILYSSTWQSNLWALKVKCP